MGNLHGFPRVAERFNNQHVVWLVKRERRWSGGCAGCVVLAESLLQLGVDNVHRIERDDLLLVLKLIGCEPLVVISPASARRAGIPGRVDRVGWASLGWPVMPFELLSATGALASQEAICVEGKFHGYLHGSLFSLAVQVEEQRLGEFIAALRMALHHEVPCVRCAHCNQDDQVGGLPSRQTGDGEAVDPPVKLARVG